MTNIKHQCKWNEGEEQRIGQWDRINRKTRVLQNTEVLYGSHICINHEIKYGTNLRVAGRAFLVFYASFPVPKEFWIFLHSPRICPLSISQILINIRCFYTCWQSSPAEILYMWRKESFARAATLPLLGHRLRWEKSLVCWHSSFHWRDFAILLQPGSAILYL